jgi:ATP-dependent RNA helicase SUPV3L1/SUV3
VRIDLVERIARATHDARDGRGPFAPDPALATSIGLEPATLDRLMGDLGSARSALPPRAMPPLDLAGPSCPPRPARCGTPGNAFAALADWGRMP